MNSHPPDQPAPRDRTVPRDPPDQQAPQEDDRLDLPRSATPDDEADRSLPDADAPGAGRGDTARSGSVHPERPVPDEPSG
ncbi:hypothetical protein [Streptomyces sp. NPDC001985]|uniref:hypothetical protein n=1 Tax=Streptomyces sp. NPDC001985 TaxID=3154406 RepID=UPI00332B95A4